MTIKCSRFLIRKQGESQFRAGGRKGQSTPNGCKWLTNITRMEGRNSICECVCTYIHIALFSSWNLITVYFLWQRITKYLFKETLLQTSENNSENLHGATTLKYINYKTEEIPYGVLEPQNFMLKRKFLSSHTFCNQSWLPSSQHYRSIYS